MSSRVSSAAFVGRRAELAELETLLGCARDGRAQLAFVTGESGVGKSRLVDEFTDRAVAAGARVLWGDCVELGDGGELPWAPVVGALRPLARAGDPVFDALGPARDELAGLLPELGATPRPTEQGRLFELLLTLLERLGREQPVVLVLEDLHWADRSTRDFLAFLARAVCRERVVVVATYRDDELHRRHPLRPVLAEVERLERSRLVPLARFTPGELAAQLTGILGTDPDPRLVERLFARSEGNALYAEELLAAGGDGRGELPPTLRDALMLRVEALSEDAQEVLRVVAAGLLVDDAVLAEVTELGARERREALRAAVAERLLVAGADGRYAFRHALLREAVEDDLLPGERAELHRALAGALEARRGGGDAGAALASAIAHHWAAAGDAERAFGAALAAAAAAERAHAPGETAALLERALELWPRVHDPQGRAGADRVDVLRRAAGAHLHVREFQRANRLLKEALAELDPAADPLRAAAVLERLGRARWELGKSEFALDAYAEGLALLPAEPPTVERAALLAGQARGLMLTARSRAAIARSEEALAAARAAGTREVEGRALITMGSARAMRGDTDGGLRDMRAAITVARADERWDDVFRAYCNLVDALHAAGRSREALALADEGLAESAAVSWPVPWLWLERSEVQFHLGDWAGADDASSPDRVGGLVGTAAVFLDVRRAELALGRGDVAEGRQRLERARDGAARSLEPQWHGPIAALLAEAHRREGRLDAGRAAVDEGLHRVSADGTQDGLWVARIAAAGASVEADASLLARASARPADAAAAVARAEALLDRGREAFLCASGDAHPEIAAHLEVATAELARARGIAAGWDAVAAAWDALERPYAAAQARRHAAEEAVAAGDRAAAAEHADAARAVAERLGARWLAEELDGLVRRARLHAPARPAEQAAAGDPLGLTPREREVLVLLAEGRTNREIGAALFMAEKTASVHVSRILAKLDVRSRTEAAAVAHRLVAAHP